jgi:Mn2+/Fe2+ NRAMP family transporter
MQADNYTFSSHLIKDPPTSFWTRLQFLGPGFILSASIVGSGELIATTVLGAKAGFVAFWVIILSCLVKVAIQIEFGKRAICTGETPMQSFSTLPGPLFRKGNWAVWTVFLLTLLKIVQLGGMLGGSAIVATMLFPGLPVIAFVLLLAALVALLIFKNYYALVEKASLFMVVAFTVLTITSLVAVSFTPFSFSMADLASGFQFNLPSELIIVAIGAFGITGVASDEIIAYNYWCLEKGYAAYCGPADNSISWKQRATGWMKVMYLDATVAMLIYTIVTAAFYILGASILHDSDNIPEGNTLIATIANIYTQTLGDGIRTAYLAGAFFVLFSSVFATLAYWSRLFSDIFGQLRWIDFTNAASRKRTIATLAWIFPITWAIVYYFIELPVMMILSGGLVGSVLLLVVVFAAVCFRYRKYNSVFKPSLMYDVILWCSIISIAMVAVYGLVKLFEYVTTTYL